MTGDTRWVAFHWWLGWRVHKGSRHVSGTSGLFHRPFFPCSSLGLPHSMVGFFHRGWLPRGSTSSWVRADASNLCSLSLGNHTASLLLHPVDESQFWSQPRSKGKRKRLHILLGGMTKNLQPSPIHHAHARDRSDTCNQDGEQQQIGHCFQLFTIVPVKGLSILPHCYMTCTVSGAGYTSPPHQIMFGHVTCFSQLNPEPKS